MPTSFTVVPVEDGRKSSHEDADDANVLHEEDEDGPGELRSPFQERWECWFPRAAAETNSTQLWPKFRKRGNLPAAFRKMFKPTSLSIVDHYSVSDI